MTAQDNRKPHFTRLRRQAEKLLADKRATTTEKWPAEIDKLFYELETHQVELEIQNEELRRAQEELSASRDRFADLYEFAPAGYITLSPKGIVLKANLTFVKTLNIKKEQLIGQRLEQYIHAQDRDNLFLTYNRIARDKQRRDTELRLIKNDGGQLWVKMQGIPVTGDSPDGRPDIRIIISDITGRKEAQKQLEENLLLLDSVIESTGDGILVVDNEGQVLHANRRFAEMWRLPDKLLRLADDRKLIYNILDQLSRPQAFLERVKQLYAGSQESLDLLHFKDQRIFERYSRPLQKNGNVIGRVWSFRDVTQQKQTEEALRRSESRYRELVENANNIIMLAKPDGTLTYVNHYAIEFFGYSNDEFIGSNAVMIIPEDDRGDFDLPDLLAGIDAHPEKYRHSINENIRRDGSRVWVAWTNCPIYNKQGKISEVLAIGTDITALKSAEEMNRLQNEILQGINTILSASLATDTEEELGRICLQVAESVTGSAFGFIGQIGPDGLLHDIAISDPGWEASSRDNTAGHRRPPGNFRIHGLYGLILHNSEPFYTNTPTAHPDSIGLPPGHPPVLAFLGAPLFEGGNTRGIICLANKPGGYSDEDVRVLESLAGAISQVFKRKRMETEIAAYQEDLENLVNNRTAELENQKEELEETNTALKVLLNKRENDRNEIEEQVVANVKCLIEPYIDKLRKSELTIQQQNLVQILTTNLNEITGPFVHRVSTQFLRLTPTEVQVANLVKQGKSTKEIADLLHTSDSTVNVHRRSIRKKLGISGDKTNLQTFLAARGKE